MIDQLNAEIRLAWRLLQEARRGTIYDKLELRLRLDALLRIRKAWRAERRSDTLPAPMPPRHTVKVRLTPRRARPPMPTTCQHCGQTEAEHTPPGSEYVSTLTGTHDFAPPSADYDTFWTSRASRGPAFDPATE